MDTLEQQVDRWNAAHEEELLGDIRALVRHRSVSLRGEPGIFPAYHMNKASWITASLDGSVQAKTIELLLDVSYELTKPKPRRKAAKGKENE